MNKKGIQLISFRTIAICTLFLCNQIYCMAPTDDIEHCLTHISRVPELDAHRISGFHFYDAHTCEPVSIRVPKISKPITIEQHTSNPSNFWIYKIAENGRGDFAGYVIKDGIPYGPRTFFGPQESREMLRNRLLLEHPTYADISGRSIRYFDGQNAQESDTALVYDIDTNRLITAYPPLESFDFSEQQATNIATALAQLQITRLSKPASWLALHDTNIKNFKAALGECTEQQQQDLLDSAATQHKWDFVEALVQNNQNLAPNALLQAIKHLNRDFTETCLRFIDDKDAHLGIGKPTPLIAICTLPAHPSKRELIALLLDEGAQINSPDEQGRTPLMYAARSGDTDTVALLIERGADPNIRDNTGKNAANFAQETLTSLKKRAGSPTALENFEIIQTCLSSPTRETEQKDKKLRKKEKNQRSATRSIPENKLVTLNTLLAQDPESAIFSTHEFIKNIIRAEINDTAEIRKKRLARINILIQKTPPTHAENLGILCNSLVKKELLTITELMKILAPEIAPSTPIDICVTRAILQAVDAVRIGASEGGLYTIRLLSMYKNAPFLACFLQKYNLIHIQFYGKTLLRNALERCSDEEIATLFIALGQKISDNELDYAIKKNKARILVATLKQHNPTWTNFKCIIQFGPNYLMQYESEIKQYCTIHQQELAELLVDAVIEKNQRTFDALCSPACMAHLATDQQGNNALMRLVQLPDCTLDTNIFFETLAQITNPLLSNKDNQTAYTLNHTDSAPVTKIIQKAQIKFYEYIRKLLSSKELNAEQLQELKEFINLPALQTDWTYNDGQTLLAYAIAHQHKEIIQTLLAKTDRLQTTYPLKTHAVPTPLCYAFVHHDEELCKQLIDRGAQWFELKICIFERAVTQQSQNTYFFELLDQIDKSDLENKYLNEQQQNEIRAEMFFYAVIHNKKNLAQQIFSSQNPLTISLEFVSIMLSYAIENGDDFFVDLLINPLIKISFEEDTQDPAHSAITLAKDSISTDPRLNITHDVIEEHKKNILKLIQENNITIQEATLIHVLQNRYINPITDTQKRVLHQLQRFPLLIEKCPSIRKAILAKAALENKDTEMTTFLLEHSANTGIPLLDLIISIGCSDTKTVQKILTEHPEIKKQIDLSIRMNKTDGSTTLTSALFYAFYTYSKLTNQSSSDTRKQERAYALAIQFFGYCENILKPIFVQNPDKDQKDLAIPPIDCLCTLTNKKLTDKDFDQFLEHTDINKACEGIYLLKYCFTKAFIVQKSSIEKDFSNEIYNYMALIDWVCKNQHIPNIQLSDEHLIATCQLLHSVWNGVYQATRMLVNIAEYQAIITRFIDLVSQLETIRQDSTVQWLISEYKDKTNGFIQAIKEAGQQSHKQHRKRS